MSKENNLSCTHKNKEKPNKVTNLKASDKEVKTTDIDLEAFESSGNNGK